MFPARKENLAAEAERVLLVFPVNLDLTDLVDLLEEPDLPVQLESPVPVVKGVRWVLHSKDSQEKRVNPVHLELLERDQDTVLTSERKIFSLDRKEIVVVGDKKVKWVKRVIPVVLDRGASMVKRDKRDSKEKSDLLDLRELKSESQAHQDWMDSTVKKETQDFVVTPEETE